MIASSDLRMLTAVLLALACLSAPARAAQRVTVKAALDQTRVPLNRTATLTVRVEWEGASGDIEVDEPSAPESATLEVAAAGSSNEVATRGGNAVATRLYPYVLKPTKVGPAEIAPITVTYKEAGGDREQSLQTPKLTLEVVRPVRDGLAAPVRAGLIAFSVVLLAALLVAAAIRVRSASRSEEAAAEEPELTPSERVSVALEEHKALRIAGTPRGYCEALAATLKSYLAEAFAFRAKELSTARIVEELAARGAGEELIGRARKVLEQCDLAKFAGTSPPAETLDELHDAVKAIVMAAVGVEEDQAVEGGSVPNGNEPGH